MARALRGIVGCLLLVGASLAAPGCSLRRMAVKSVADTLAGSGETFASDEDLELVREAAPFSLKLMESLLAEVPTHRGLLLATCSGFTQYAYAFLHTDAALIEHEDFERSEALKARARRMYLRARDYCLRHLELGYRGLGARLRADPVRAVRVVRREDVAGLYWTAASWGAAIALGLDRPDLIADLPVVRALFDRALALDETFGDGAVHEALISLDALPEAMGGSAARAREHFDRAVALSKGRAAGPYVTLASTVVVNEQNRAEFERLLKEALAVDPDADPRRRLANLVAQRRARYLLDHVEWFFVSDPARARESAWRRPSRVGIYGVMLDAPDAWLSGVVSVPQPSSDVTGASRGCARSRPTSGDDRRGREKRSESCER